MNRKLFFLCFLPSLPLVAQPELTLREAVRQALAQHPSIEAAGARTKASLMRIDQARSGNLPKVNYSESFETSNNPVFVFGTLLTQRRFSEQNFALDSLNRPGFVPNFRSQVTAEQLAWDFGGGVRSQIESARLGSQSSAEQERLARMRVIARVVAAYHHVILSAENLKTAKQAVASAESDLARAESIRSAGMSTDADVLSIRVHLAAIREQEIHRASQLQVARAALNESLGLPLDTQQVLTSPLAALTRAGGNRESAEKQASTERPEMRQANLARRIAEAQSSEARAAFYPQLVARAAFETDRGRFVKQAGTNWAFGVSLRWNLFNGYADKARIDEAAHAVAGAKAREREMTAAVQLQVREAHAAVESAGERIEVATAAVAQAEESLRITKNRYEAGLATVTDLLRTETAVVESRTRKLAAIYDQRIAAAMLEMAAGTLSGDSDVLQ